MPKHTRRTRLSQRGHRLSSTSKPYVRGAAMPLRLCPDCKCWMPLDHNCKEQTP